jgi:hypothetical protein
MVAGRREMWMQKMSWCIVAYGLLLVLCSVAERSTGAPAYLDSATVAPCWSIGAIIIAAGIASNLGRRSLRNTGFGVGMILPIVLGALLGWRAAQLGMASQSPASIGLSVLAALSLGTVLLILYLRPREGVASRGYAVPISPPKPSVTPPVAESKRRSEAG